MTRYMSALMVTAPSGAMDVDRASARRAPPSRLVLSIFPPWVIRTMQRVEDAFCMELVKCASVTTTNNPDADATS